MSEVLIRSSISLNRSNLFLFSTELPDPSLKNNYSRESKSFFANKNLGLSGRKLIVSNKLIVDKTKEIATKYPVNFIEREWKGFADQKKYALSKATKEWVLAIDADEVASEELKIEIQSSPNRSRTLNKLHLLEVILS